MLGSCVSVFKCWLIPSINTPNQPSRDPWSTLHQHLGWHSVSTLSTSQSVKSWQIFNPFVWVINCDWASIRMTIKYQSRCQLRIWIRNIKYSVHTSTHDPNVARPTQWISCMGDTAWAYDQQIAITSLHPARTKVNKRSNSDSHFALLTTLLKVHVLHILYFSYCTICMYCNKGPCSY